jgi:SAM-dependent methyltransferase
MNEHDESPAIPIGGMNWGGLRRQEPVSNRWGFDRGLPVDRYYISQFLARQSEAIQGRCIELMNSDYTVRHGQARVSQADVLDINPLNAKATIVGDLTRPGLLESASYDCFILTQVLNVIYDVRAVMRNCYDALKPGGSLLVTAPCMCRYSPHPEDFWRFTDRSLARLIGDSTDCEDFEVEVHGNLVASMAFLMGLAADELAPAELEHRDPRFPILVAARLRKK